MEIDEGNVAESGKGNSFIDLEGPTELEAGQNFFDQPPFAEIFAETSAAYGIPIRNLQVAISRFSHARNNSKILMESASSIIRFGVLGPSVRKGVDQEKIAAADGETLDDKIGSIIERVVVEKLGNFPLWTDYVRAKQDNAFYNQDGGFKEEKLLPNSGYINTPTISYAEYVFRRQQTQGRLDSYVIQEMFATNSGTQPLEQVRSTGKSAGSRKWRIIRSAEIGKKQ